MNSAGPFTLPNIKAHPQDYIGPGLVSSFVQAILTGIIYSQSVQFWTQSHRETPIVNCLVGFVSSVAVYQTVAAFYVTWRAHVTLYGDWVNAVNFAWPDRTQNVVTTVMSCPVQVFLIWRCYILSNRKLTTLLPLSVLLLGCVVVSAVTTAMVFNFDFVAPLRGPVPPLPSDVALNIEINYTLNMVFSAAMDVALTSILLVYLLRSRSSVATHQFRKVLYGLVAITWESALPPCACAIATLAVFLRWAEHNYWNLVFQATLGKLYVISLLFTLNSRAELRAKVRANELELPDIYWTSLPQPRGDAPEPFADEIDLGPVSPQVSVIRHAVEPREKDKDWFAGGSSQACGSSPSQPSTLV
ncbi:hypothetical protein GLOTRDRAFT_139573 [Gloeophyllum trabeum ATCC 11539]|uniref:DUF6534 domain-containing protein n=1 Tax=Gloeophyllum trabeum (strain ATCC 11539 / FP-39264 / Madison 617) TaxID=670483 RepID=S7Q3X6_GLOTA|nr:uncharacterized protein GLOTRDRAFT_139573 [Gloeophyllum trabeum ATCC 11539]EPQ54237.1 hypothetical protein GLOTRDRAFT_139573 [Gloeophyllum trabeum ATCC 11539]